MANLRLGVSDPAYRFGFEQFNSKEEIMTHSGIGSPTASVLSCGFVTDRGLHQRSAAASRVLAGNRVGRYNSESGTVACNKMLTQENREMISPASRMAAIFVDRSCTEHWIVRDPEGDFWIVPSVENAWESRRPFQPTEDTDLQAIPGHYKSMLGLPF
jgi:hypothetical protein